MSQTRQLKKNLLVNQRPSTDWDKPLKDFRIVAEETPRPERK